MFHEFEPLFDNQYRDAAPGPGSLVLYCSPEAVFVRGEEPLSFPTFEEVPAAGSRFIYLFTLGGRECFLADGGEGCVPAGLRALPLMALRGAAPRELAFAGITGHHLYRWYNTRRFCGACGTKTTLDAAERMVCCPACGQKEYPTIMPAVIVAVHDGDRLLLTKYAGRANARWALVAGFSEIGESLEGTVRREVAEETGLRVRDVRFYKSQPWPFSGSLLAGFYAALDGPADVTLDGKELGEAVWMRRAEIPVAFDGCSLTNEMICRFRDRGAEDLLWEDDQRTAAAGEPVRALA